MDEPVGQVVELWGQYNLEIIGVVKDFHFQSLHSEIEPLFFILVPEHNWKVMARIDSENVPATIEAIKTLHNNFNPGFDFIYRFQDEQYARLYASEQQVSKLSSYFAGIAILISCLGLFGLAAFTAERRNKEIGIRKALGSTTMNIVFLLSKDFTRMVIAAILIGIPVSYFILKSYLERFAYRIELDVWFFIAAGIIALVIALITVGYQAFKSGTTNPATCLRDE
jgi:ABC-type antimicrobial peptide transport system permease subunit